MESDKSELQSEDSTYSYLYLQKNDHEENDKEKRNQNNEEWDDCFFNDSRSDFVVFSGKAQIEKVVNSNLGKGSSWNLQEDSCASKLSVAEHRLNMISRLKDLYEDHKKLKLKNSFLHKKCRDIFMKLKIMNRIERWGFDSDIHNDKRYIEVLKEFEKVKKNKNKSEDSYKQELKMIEDSYQHHCIVFREAFQEFISRELEIGALSINKEAKKISNVSVMTLSNIQQQRLNILSRVRVKYLKLQNLLASVHSKLDNKNILGEGYTMIEYENLMMNKHILSEKIDEKVKELEIIRDKFFSIVHVLAHVKEVSVGISREIEEVAVKLVNSENLKREKQLELNKQRDLIRKQIVHKKHCIKSHIRN